MNKKQRNNLTIAVILLMVLLGVLFVYDWIHKVTEDKPYGSYYSASSIEEAKKEKVWVSTYLPLRRTHYSSDKRDSIVLGDIWIEQSKKNKKYSPGQAGYKYILSAKFKRLTSRNLHKFRVIPRDPLELDDYRKAAHPDGPQRVRFLMNEIKDTIWIEIIERNPNDSLAWRTEKIIDTITIIKGTKHNLH